MALPDTGRGHSLAAIAAYSLLSLPFAIDSIGIKTITVAHGLTFTPNIHDIQATVVKDSPVDDWGYNLLKIEHLDAINIIVKINVSLASSIVGATVKLSLLILAREYSGRDLIDRLSWFQQPPVPVRRKSGTREGASVIAPSQLP